MRSTMPARHGESENEYESGAILTLALALTPTRYILPIPITYFYAIVEYTPHLFISILLDYPTFAS